MHWDTVAQLNHSSESYNTSVRQIARIFSDIQGPQLLVTNFDDKYFQSRFYCVLSTF